MFIQHRGHIFSPRLFLALALSVFSVASCFFCPGAIAAFAPETQVEHAEPHHIARNHRIQLEAKISDPAGIVSARCYFHYQPETPYLFVDMSGDPGHQYGCVLPAPARNVEQIEYLFVVVDAQQRVVRTPAHQLPVVSETDVPAELAGDTARITVKSDLPYGTDILDIFSASDMPDYEAAPAESRDGLRVGLYDLSANPKYHYGFFRGFLLNEHQEIEAIKGYAAFPVQAVKESSVYAPADSGADTANYPDITGDNWSGYFYKAKQARTVEIVSARIPVTARVVRDSDGSVGITILTNQNCPGRRTFGRGAINTSGDIRIYDVLCDNELWTTHWTRATSSYIQIADYIDIEEYGYTYLYVVELTRPEPKPDLSSLYLLLLQKDGASAAE